MFGNPPPDDFSVLSSLPPLCCSFKDAYIKCEDPNPSLYTFVGTLECGGETISIPSSSILLRDSKLRNTDWVVGAVIFTGHDTKVMQNATDPPSKRSSLEKQMDKIILALFLWLFIMAFVTGLVYGEPLASTVDSPNSCFDFPSLCQHSWGSQAENQDQVGD